MSLKNLIIKGMVKTLQKWIKQHPKIKSNRILVVTTTGLGDTLWATPAIESLRKSFPNSYIAALTSPLGSQILEGNPHLSQIYTLDRFSFSLWKKLYKDRFDAVLLFHASQRLTLPLCTLIGAGQIIGTSGINKGLDCLLTDPLPPIYEHEIRRRLHIVKKIGGQISRETLSFFLHPEEKMPKLPKRQIALHPGSKDGFKRWPAENFIQLGKEIKNKLDCDILVTGTAAEEILMKEVASQIPGALIADPKLSLRNFAALLDQTDLLISNDTGPFHLACALNKPVIGIYSSTDPNLCGAHLAPLATVINKQFTCQPCLKRKCRTPFCFLQIGISEVLNASLKILLN